MSRRVPRPLLVTVAAVLLGAVARAEEPKTYEFPVRETWKPGEVVSWHGSLSKDQKVSVKTADGAPIPGAGGDTAEAVEYDLVSKVLEVDAEGRPTKSLVHVAAWTRKSGEETDTSLAGAHVDVTGVGSARTAKVLRAPSEPSQAAKAWVQQHFSTRGDERREALAPPKPLAIGESWTIEPAKLVALFDEPNQKHLPEKSAGKVTLVGVEDGIGEFRFEATLQTESLATPMGSLAWSEGGALVFDVTFTRALDAGRHEGRASSEVRFAGKAAPPGASVDVDVRSRQTSTAKGGGEMPEPKPDAPPGK